MIFEVTLLKQKSLLENDKQKNLRNALYASCISIYIFYSV